MFNVQGTEIIILLLLALVVLGPEKLPEAMRKAGKAYAELRKMSSGFQEEFRKAVQEPVAEVQATANLLRDSVDLNKLAAGERAEKPKTAEMAPAVVQVENPPPPTDATPSFDTVDGVTVDGVADHGSAEIGEPGAASEAAEPSEPATDGPA